MSLGCDLLEIAAKEYAIGARSLQALAKQIQTRYGDTLRPDVLQAVYQKAADRYRTDFKKLDDIKAEMAKTVVGEMRKDWSPSRRAGEAVLETTELPRALMASGDFSTTLRQGIFASASHPKMALKNFGSQARAMFGSRKYGVTGEGWAAAVKEEINARPNAPLYKESGLALTDPLHGENPLIMEENFQSGLAHRIPGVKSIVGASERASVTFLNKMRADLFDDMVKRADPGDGSLSLSDAKEIASYVNNATGRGPLPGHLTAASRALSTVVFSPRLASSRIAYLLGPGKMLLDQVGKGSRFAEFSPAQKVIAVEYVRALGAIGSVMALAKLSGMEVGTDSNSPDFLKIKNGNMRHDITGGLQQYMVLISRMVSGKATSSGGRERDLTTGGFGKSTRGSVLAHSLRGKVAPVAGMVTDALVKERRGYPASATGMDYQIGTDFLGRPTTPLSQVQRLMIPLVITGTLNSIAEKEGVPKALIGGALETLGISTSAYNDKKPPVKNAPELPIQDAVKEIVTPGSTSQ